MKKIVFLSGTRADFGKIKSLLLALEAHKAFEVYLFVTGMHMMEEYGFTVLEVKRTGMKHIETFENHTSESTMELSLAQTIVGFSKYVRKIKPDMVVVHGDRVEALAGAIVGSLNNILVSHIEGGELSGTIDELMRHAASKMSHIHFVSNEEAKKRLVQMGETSNSIRVIGSPDIDVLMSDSLPPLNVAKSYYGISFSDFAIGIFHPITTENEQIAMQAKAYLQALENSGLNYVLIYPNNDLGSKTIIEKLSDYKDHPRFRILPSLRFEYFLTLLKNARFIVGNSSAGIREAPYSGVPTVNIGTRQNNRYFGDSILNTSYDSKAILKAIEKANSTSHRPAVQPFGRGNSTALFMAYLESDEPWSTPKQKQFVESLL
ncbi:MAG: UDP-N-acetylglucosamine 2-epimerase [Salibacteraceae bacterium]